MNQRGREREREIEGVRSSSRVEFVVTTVGIQSVHTTTGANKQTNKQTTNYTVRYHTYFQGKLDVRIRFSNRIRIDQVFNTIEDDSEDGHALLSCCCCSCFFVLWEERNGRRMTAAAAFGWMDANPDTTHSSSFVP